MTDKVGAGEVFLVFLKLGLTSFGGPVAHLGYIRAEFVDRRLAALAAWTQSRVWSLRSRNAIPTYREGERQERGEVTLDEAAAILSVSPSTVRRLISDGQLRQITYVRERLGYRAADLERSDVRRAAPARHLSRPPSDNLLQKAFSSAVSVCYR